MLTPCSWLRLRTDGSFRRGDTGPVHAFGQQRSEMLVAGHAVSLIVAIQME
jgi:hypothetical protein